MSIMLFVSDVSEHKHVVRLVYTAGYGPAVLRSKSISYKGFWLLSTKKRWKMPLMQSFIATCCSQSLHGQARIWHKCFYRAYGKNDSIRIKELLRKFGALQYSNNDYKPGERTRMYKMRIITADMLMEAPEISQKHIAQFNEARGLFMNEANEGQKWVFETLTNHCDWYHGVYSYIETLKGVVEVDRFGVEKEPFIEAAKVTNKIGPDAVLEWAPTIGGKGGRMYHPLTNIKREVRRFLEIDGEITAEVDVKSCFPYLAAGLYENECQEKADYLRLINDGFYEWIQKLYAASHPGESLDRDECKGLVFANIFFARRGQKRLQWLWNAFESRFPMLTSQIGLQASLAAKLQQIEVSQIFDVVVKLKNMGIRVVTIHDSLMVPERHAVTAERILSEHLTRSMGFHPGINTQNNDEFRSQFKEVEKPRITETMKKIHQVSEIIPMDNWTEEEKAIVADEFSKFVWRMPRGSEFGLTGWASNQEVDPDHMDGLLECVIAIKDEDNTFLSEWMVSKVDKGRGIKVRLDRVE